MQKTIRIKAAPQYATGGWAQQIGGRLNTSWNQPGFYDKEGQVTVRETLPKVPRQEANAVLENDEIAMIPTEDGMGVQKADSGSHASGNDHPTMLEEGSMIISDTKSLKEKDPAAQSMFNKPYKKGGYTYTELAKPFMGVFNRAEKALNNKDMSIDPMKEKTMALNQQNAMNKLQQVFQLQEMRKQERGIGQPTMEARYGGKMFEGGGVNDEAIIPGAVNIPYNRGNKFKGYPREEAQRLIKQYGRGHDTIPYTPEIAAGIGYQGQYGHNTMGLQRWEQEQDPGYPVSPGSGNPEGKLGIRTLSPNRPLYGVDPWSIPHTTPSMPNNNNIGTVPAPDYPVPYAGNRVIPPSLPLATDKTKRGKDRGVKGNISAANISDAVTAAKLLSIKKHLPWEPAVNVKYPDMLLESDQPIRNVLAEQTNQLSNAMYSGDSKAGRAAAQNAQSELLRRSVQAAGEVGNRNVNTYNQFSQLRSQLGTAEEAAKRDRAKRLYDGTIIANQQYTNAMNAGLDVVAKTAAEREEQAAFLHNQNMTNPYYQLDRTGKLRWNSENTRDKYLSDVLAGREGSGVSGNEGALYKQYVDQYSEYMSTERAEQAAYDKVFGKSQTTREKTKVGNKETVKTTKEKYGGYMNKLPKK